jgi:hypothetical protein
MYVLYFFLLQNTESLGDVQIIGGDDMSRIKGKVIYIIFLFII